ncbi:MAG: AAA family ATPase [Deltaproteobacteria bacterium]|nr:AAA family ATPase [Deltaproteobacteria bacterium]
MTYSFNEDSKGMVEKHFGFRENPFGVTPDPRYFYDHSLYMKGLSQLIHGVQAKKGMLLVTGDPGTGKTTLLRKLMRHLPSTHFISVSSSRHVTASNMLEWLCEELGIEVGDKSALRLHKDLELHLFEQLQQKRSVALLLDEAQELHDDALEALCDLSNLETDKEKLLQIVMAGEPELASQLGVPSLAPVKQRLAMHYRLTPLQYHGDVESYLRHRLEVAAYVGPDIFERDATVELWAYSGGTPRLINALCDNSLSLALAGGNKKVTADMVRRAAELLMLERRDGLAAQVEAVEPALPHLSIAKQQKPKNEERPQSEAKPAVEQPTPLRVVEPSPILNRDHAAREAVADLAAKRERPVTHPVAHPERADVERLKAAMAAIRLPPPIAREATAEQPAQTINLAPPEPAQPAPVKVPQEVLPPLSQTPAPAPIDELTTTAEQNPAGMRTIILKEANVPPQFFDYMVHEATEGLGPIGEFVVQEHIEGLGETREAFPRKKLLALVEAVGAEIGNKQMRANFEVTMRREIRGFRTF